MNYDTQMLSSSDEDIDKAAKLLREGGVVGIPTETVYGLAADAQNSSAVSEIFKAKGRPQDNPLIVHIGEFSDIYKYVTEVPENALKLAEAFWPGPLTMVLPKKDIIPMTTSGGLDTVGIRFPIHPVAREIIRRSGCALAAPSANLSGSPSPTTAMHVYKDMNGRIPAIVDGGDCAVGVESTVVSFDSDGKVRLLRPGFVSLEDIKGVVGEKNALCAKGVTEKISDGERVLSPGMKYKHYSPKAEVFIVNAHGKRFEDWCLAHEKGRTLALSADPVEHGMFRCFGTDVQAQAHRLFALLREADDEGAQTVYVEIPSKDGIGLAVYNRLLRAAAFRIVEADE